MNLQQLLLDKGYKPYRLVYINKELVYKPDFMNGFSTVVNGGLDIRYILNEDYQNQIIFGLHEVKKPPTLIYPRPKILVKRYNSIENRIDIHNQLFDNSMNICLQKEKPEDIYKAMFDTSIEFKYDLTT